MESEPGSDYRAAMSSRSPVKLSILRDIGWREWDPIGLRTIEGGWEGSSAADEYDSYLLKVVGRLQSGEPDSPLVDFLLGSEIEYMGLGFTPSARPRAVATVKAIREYVSTLT